MNGAKTLVLTMGVLLLLEPLSFLRAGSRAGGDYEIQAESVDVGGQAVTGGVYRMEGCIGGIAGIADHSSPDETLKAGYIGQLTEVSNLTINATASVNEGDVNALSAVAGLDDFTTVSLAGSNVTWNAPSYPVASIDAAGVATASVVYEGTNATVIGVFLDVSGAGVFGVIDSDPDNYGLYAGDGLPDWWQVRYFGLSNTDAFPDFDATGDGRNNWYKYVADLNPTNIASQFAILAITNEPSNWRVYFPASSNRLYTLLWTTNLLDVPPTNSPGVLPVAGNGEVFSLVDTNAASPVYYRVKVQLP